MGSESLDRRKERWDLMESRPDLREAELILCRESISWWINNWCYTVDPRDMKVYPFDLWPKQEAFLVWVQEMIRRRVRGACKKARDGGFSWLCCGVAVHGLLFSRHFVCGFGSRKLEYVDRLGDMKSLFEKCRFLLYGLPRWMMPRDYDRRADDNSCRILNRESGCAIVGEGGDSIGRGDRTTLYFVDESAFLEHPEMAETALSATTNTRIDISSVNGAGTVFAQTCRRLPADQVFTAHWTDDPRKSEEWAVLKREEIGEAAFASEYDCDEAASVEDVVIPPRWVRAAINLVLLPPGASDWNVNVPGSVRCQNCSGYGHTHAWQPLEAGHPLFEQNRCPDCNGLGYRANRNEVPRWKGSTVTAGFDVAEEGKDLCVVIVREGPVVLKEWITSWGQLNTTASAWKARECLEDWCLNNLELEDLPEGSVGAVLMTPTPSFKQRLICNYDAGGPGMGVKGTWAESDDPMLFDVCPLLAGATPSEAVWPDGKTSKEKFANLRAEGWWMLRRRFERTYEWVQHQKDPGDPKYARAASYQLDELISIPDHAQLIADLSLLSYSMTETGKIKIQSKSEVAKSPDFGDACWQAFYVGPKKRKLSLA